MGRVLDAIRAERARLGSAVLYRNAAANVDRIVALLEGCPERHHDRLAACLAQVEPGVYDRFAGVAAEWAQRQLPLCPAYPHAPRTFQARLSLGAKPADLYPGLTPKEAHEALGLGCKTPIAYLLRGFEFGDRLGVRSVRVARWLVAVSNDPPRWEAMIRIEDPGEAYWGRLDEIEDADLPDGIATGVARAFDRADARAEAANRGLRHAAGERLAPPPPWWKPMRCATLLNTRELLEREGTAMHHCVGGYAYRVAQGDCVLIAFRVRVFRNKALLRVERSTAELMPNGRTAQHRGPFNREPGAFCRAALEIGKRRWLGALGQRGC